MIVINKTIKISNIHPGFDLIYDEKNDIYKDAIFFDLEHYVYKRPVCIGVFGCCYYNKENDTLELTQYMIENRNDARKIIFMAKKYFIDMYKKHSKRYIVTFSGNNDFTIINYLFNKYSIELDFNNMFKHIDLQKEYEKQTKNCIGLKKLEVIFEINRTSELISGQNLSKTFSKIMKDNEYIKRMPKEKVEKILVYNEQDIVSLFYMLTQWKKYTEKQNPEDVSKL